MTKDNDLTKHLRYGDHQTIAEMAKVSADYVRKVLKGDRKNEDVIKATETLIQQRSEMKTKFQNS